MYCEIDPYPKTHPQIIFRDNKRPTMTEDLSKVSTYITELFIHGDVKNVERLSTFSRLNKLWVYLVNKEELGTITSLVNPKMLHLYDIRATDLSSLSALTNTEILDLDWNTKATSLWDISSNLSLKALSINDFSKLNDISSLENNNSLEILDMSGGNSKPLRLDNLKPLGTLKQVKFLGLSNLKVLDESLEPLSSLKTLQRLEISNQFPTEEYAKLSMRLTQTKCDKFNAYVHLCSPIAGKGIMVVGKRKPFLNKEDINRIKKYEVQFKKLQDKYK